MGTASLFQIHHKVQVEITHMSNVPRSSSIIGGSQKVEVAHVPQPMNGKIKLAMEYFSVMKRNLPLALPWMNFEDIVLRGLSFQK